MILDTGDPEVDRLRRASATRFGADALVATTPENLLFLSGIDLVGPSIFGGHAAAVLELDTGQLSLFLPDYAAALDSVAQAQAELFFEPVIDYLGPEVVGRHLPPSHRGLVETLSRGDIGRGVLARGLADRLDALRRRGSNIIIDDTSRLPDGLHDRVDGQRLRQDPEAFRALRRPKSLREVERLTMAAKLNEQALRAAMETVAAGVPWRDVGAAWRASFAAGGGVPRFWFSAAGDRSIGIFEQRDHVLAAGELIRFECGGTLDGFWADTGRSASVSVPRDDLAARHGALVAGHDRYLDLAAAGEPLGVAVEAMYDTIRDAGFIDFPDAGWSHGIGIEAYDQPIALADPRATLEGGEVFALETPCFLLGWGAMQLEDTYHHAQGELRRLTEMDREPFVLGD